jgi:hypothetical protein
MNSSQSKYCSFDKGEQPTCIGFHYNNEFYYTKIYKINKDIQPMCVRHICLACCV